MSFFNCNNRKLWSLGMAFLLTLVLTNCQTDLTKQKEVNQLEGKWILVEGFRGGKKTESLNDTYFSFTDKTMSTNLPIKGATNSPYIQKEAVITQTIVNDLTIDYSIQDLSDQQLILSTTLRDLNFTFVLKRETPQ